MAEVRGLGSRRPGRPRRLPWSYSVFIRVSLGCSPRRVRAAARWAGRDRDVRAQVVVAGPRRAARRCSARRCRPRASVSTRMPSVGPIGGAANASHLVEHRSERGRARGQADSGARELEEATARHAAASALAGTDRRWRARSSKSSSSIGCSSRELDVGGEHDHRGEVDRGPVGATSTSARPRSPAGR